MNNLLFQLHSWLRAIDGDAFFTSCEEAIHPELRGKPIIAGGEWGIVACASYAAKKRGIKQELGIGITLGFSLTKVLAKVASKHEKPDGFTVIPGRTIPLFLRDLPVEKVWGVGHATAHYLSKLGVRTALEFARLPEAMIKRHFTKTGREIWMELRGESVYPVVSEEKSTYASISKTKTFAPPTADREYLFAQLLRNVESACIKARRYYIDPRKIAIFLKKNDFTITGVEAKLVCPSAYPLELTGLMKQLFESVYQTRVPYRATGVVLMDLMEDRYIQYSLFESPVKIEKIEKIYEAADFLGEKYGKHTLHLGASHPLDQFGTGRRGEPTARTDPFLRGNPAKAPGTVDPPCEGVVHTICYQGHISEGIKSLKYISLWFVCNRITTLEPDL